MLTASPSPGLNAASRSSSRPAPSPHAHYDSVRKTSISASPIVKPRSAHVDAAAPQPTPDSPQWSRDKYSGPGSSASIDIPPPPSSRRNMVDAGTQYSPPPGYYSPPFPRRRPQQQQFQPQRPPTPEPAPTPTPAPVSAPAPTPAPASAPVIAKTPLAADVQQTQPSSDAAMPSIPPLEATSSAKQAPSRSPISKRQNSVSGPTVPAQPATTIASEQPKDEDHGPSKRARGEGPPVKIMPIQYETCDTKELVILISSMLMELIRYNDAIPLRDGALTRFHSRAPPGISVTDYLQRLTTHATLSPPILLSMVYYIDKMCALYPAFTISSLTVHRFLITSATVASKGLSDSFWTNKTYARVGGVSIKELATLELEFLGRVQWRIVPKPEVLIDYYRSLVERSPGYELEQAGPEKESV